MVKTHHPSRRGTDDADSASASAANAPRRQAAHCDLAEQVGGVAVDRLRRIPHGSSHDRVAMPDRQSSAAGPRARRSSSDCRRSRARCSASAGRCCRVAADAVSVRCACPGDALLAGDRPSMTVVHDHMSIQSTSVGRDSVWANCSTHATAVPTSTSTEPGIVIVSPNELWGNSTSSGGSATLESA
jgi:hypothetical protein